MQEDTIHHPSKLLVIDDQDNTRTLLRRRLAMYGHEVFDATSKTKAIDILNKNSIDVILLNMFLAKENTLNFLTNLKNNEKFQNIPIIMISSDNDVELLTQCIESGAEDYLVRPLNQTILRARLSNCISRREAYQKEIAYLATIEHGQQKIKEQEHFATIGNIVGSISQELKNPLNFIINFSKISADVCEELKKEIDSSNNGISSKISETVIKLHDNIDKISKYGIDIHQIIKFMLEQTQTDNTKYLANINKIITQTVNLIKSSYKSKNMGKMPEITFHLDQNISHMKLSVQLISKVIRNILDNAIYAVTKKFEDISQAKIEITAQQDQDDIIITISDNGIGISKENQPRIFEPFFSTKEDGNNPGLGLSNSEEIIKEMHGSIRVTSEEGKFTEFKITIPKSDE